MTTNAPVGYDDQGNPIETVVVVARPLTDWPKLILLALSFLAFVKVATNEKSKWHDLF